MWVGCGCQSMYDIKYDQIRNIDVSEKKIFSVYFTCEWNIQRSWESYQTKWFSFIWHLPPTTSLQFRKEDPSLLRKDWDSLNKDTSAQVPTELEDYTPQNGYNYDK